MALGDITFGGARVELEELRPLLELGDLKPLLKKLINQNTIQSFNFGLNPGGTKNISIPQGFNAIAITAVKVTGPNTGNPAATITANGSGGATFTSTGEFAGIIRGKTISVTAESTGKVAVSGYFYIESNPEG
jgi:hypothetical protein